MRGSVVLKTAILGMTAALIACGPFSPSRPEVADDEWTREYVEAGHLAPDEAQQRFAELAETAPGDPQARDAEFERARMALKAGDVDEARRLFDELYGANPDDRVASRALYERGRIAYEHDGDADDARQFLHRAITETPPWAGSELALDFYVRTERRDDRPQRLAGDLGRLAEDADDERMIAQIYLHRGVVLDEDLGDADGALDAYRSAYDTCFDCAAADEALFQMGQIYARHQNWDAALEAYAIVADRTKRSFFIGTYSSQRASDARYEMGRIEMLFRRDYEAATDHFEEFLSAFEGHLNADRVAWHLVEIERLSGTDRSHRRALEQFIDDYPHSRRIDRAKQLLAEAT